MLNNQKTQSDNVQFKRILQSHILIYSWVDLLALLKNIIKPSRNAGNALCATADKDPVWCSNGAAAVCHSCVRVSKEASPGEWAKQTLSLSSDDFRLRETSELILLVFKQGKARVVIGVIVSAKNSQTPKEPDLELLVNDAVVIFL